MFSAPRDPRHNERHGQRIFLMTPWGQVAIMDLSPEELDIVTDLMQMTGDNFEKVVTDIAKDRFFSTFGM